MKKKTTMLLLVAVMGTMLSCGKENKSNSDEFIIGKWLVESITRNGVEHDSYPYSGWYFLFKSNGTFEQKTPKQRTGKYSIIGDTLRMWDEDSQGILFDNKIVIKSITKNSMVWEESNERVYKLKKDS